MGEWGVGLLGLGDGEGDGDGDSAGGSRLARFRLWDFCLVGNSLEFSKLSSALFSPFLSTAIHMFFFYFSGMKIATSST